MYLRRLLEIRTLHIAAGIFSCQAHFIEVHGFCFGPVSTEIQTDTNRIPGHRLHPQRPWCSALGTSPPPPSWPWSRRGDSSPCLISPAPRAPAVHSRKQTLHPPPSFWHRAPKILRIPKALSDTILSFVMFVR